MEWEYKKGLYIKVRAQARQKPYRNEKARAMTARGDIVRQLPLLCFMQRKAKKAGDACQNAISLFLENFMNSSSDAVVTASRMVAMAEATPSLPCTTLV